MYLYLYTDLAFSIRRAVHSRSHELNAQLASQQPPVRQSDVAAFKKKMKKKSGVPFSYGRKLHLVEDNFPHPGANGFRSLSQNICHSAHNGHISSGYSFNGYQAACLFFNGPMAS